jgi:hypothetical protein
MDMNWTTAPARKAYARAALTELLSWATLGETVPPTSHGVIAGDWAQVLAGMLHARLRTLDAGWQPQPVSGDARQQIQDGFTRLRAVAHAVARKQPSPLQTVTLEIGMDRGRRVVRGSLGDAIVCLGVSLLAQVPAGLIRTCCLAPCARVFVGGKNQKFCSIHQTEARRLVQRKAEKNWRARQKKARRRKTR